MMILGLEISIGNKKFKSMNHFYGVTCLVLITGITGITGITRAITVITIIYHWIPTYLCPFFPKMPCPPPTELFNFQATEGRRSVETFARRHLGTTQLLTV